MLCEQDAIVVVRQLLATKATLHKSEAAARRRNTVEAPTDSNNNVRYLVPSSFASAALASGLRVCLLPTCCESYHPELPSTTRHG